MQALQRHAQRMCGSSAPHIIRSTSGVVVPCRRAVVTRVIYDPSGLTGGVPGYKSINEKEVESMIAAAAEHGETVGGVGVPDAATSSSSSSTSLFDSPPTPPGVEKVPISELPKPHPKAQKTLNKALNKAGVYKALVDTLGSVSFTIVCDDHELGWEVALGLSRRIGWFPVSTGRVLAGLHKVEGASAPEPGTGGVGGTVPERSKLLAALGSEEELAKAEQGVLKGLGSQRRVIACTVPNGALTKSEAWREVWGSFIVWIDEVDKGVSKPSSPGRKLLTSQSEMLVRLKKGRGFQANTQSTTDKAKVVLDSLLRDLVDYLNDHPDIIERKVKYVTYGCRGDWPVVQPPDWNPVVDRASQPTTQPPTAQPTV